MVLSRCLQAHSDGNKYIDFPFQVASTHTRARRPLHQQHRLEGQGETGLSFPWVQGERETGPQTQEAGRVH